MNKNYQSGVRFERAIQHEYIARNCYAYRTAGSHGHFDVIAVDPGHVVDFVQCKVTTSTAQAERLCKAFLATPPLPLGPYRQILEVKITRQGRKTVIIERVTS